MFPFCTHQLLLLQVLKWSKQRRSERTPHINSHPSPYSCDSQKTSHAFEVSRQQAPFPKAGIWNAQLWKNAIGPRKRLCHPSTMGTLCGVRMAGNIRAPQLVALAWLPAPVGFEFMHSRAILLHAQPCWGQEVSWPVAHLEVSGSQLWGVTYSLENMIKATDSTEETDVHTEHLPECDPPHPGLWNPGRKPLYSGPQTTIIRTSTLFSTEAVPFCMPTSSAQMRQRPDPNAPQPRAQRSFCQWL